MKRSIYIYIGKRDRKGLFTFTLHSLESVRRVVARGRQFGLPWHRSEFAVEEGRVLNSPATAPQLLCRARARRPDRGGRTNDAGPPRAGILPCKLRGSARDSRGR